MTSVAGWDGRKLSLWKTWNSPKPTAHFSFKWLTKPSKQVMVSAPAALTAAPPTPIFHAQGACPQTTSSLSASEQSPTRAIHIPTFCVTVSFKTTFPTLQDPLSPGRSRRSLVSVTFTICPLSALMPLFPKTNFSASTYARMHQKYQNIQLEKTEQSFTLLSPGASFSVVEAFSGWQCSFLGVTDKSSLSAQERLGIASSFAAVRRSFDSYFILKSIKKPPSFLQAVAGSSCSVSLSGPVATAEQLAGVSGGGMVDVSGSPEECSADGDGSPGTQTGWGPHSREIPYNNIRAGRSCLPGGVQNHTLSTKNACSVVAVTKNYRTL